ncbi:thioredoxin family protein [Candidatus Pacearchaeota archaeon]|nr:thioredoxin family protein [Candidatus Pacearchaeota archaeon]
MQNRLLMFYGTECSHCHDAEPIIDKLAQELKLKVTKLEVWHNSENKKLMVKFDKIKCGGVPFFYNEKNGKALCGNQSEAVFRKWMKGD